MPATQEIHPDLKAESYPTWASNDLSFGLWAYSAVSPFPAPCCPHSSISVPFRERGEENKPHVFGEESLTGCVPDQSASSSSSPWHQLALPCHYGQSWLIYVGMLPFGQGRVSARKGGVGVRNDVIWSPQWKGACGGRNGVAFGL